MTTASARVSEKPALFGGPKAVTRDPADAFAWPIVTEEDERAVLEVLRAGNMSGTDVTRRFEAEFAEWMGLPFALAHCNGTAALQAAMWAVGVGSGDEVICPSMTYWASGLPALTLGATVVWADIQRRTLCLDPADVGKRLSDRTKAIVVVHYAGYPADVDAIMELAEPRGIKVIEDVSHAHGGVRKGRKLGTLGHVAAFSCMSGKSLPIGEGGMLVRHAGHRRQGDLRAGHPVGPLRAARGADARAAEGHERADASAGAHRPAAGGRQAPDQPARLGHWYNARGLYVAEELGGLPLGRFCEALRAEGFPAEPGANMPLHLQAVNELDIYGDGEPTLLANATRDVRVPAGSLPVSEAIDEFCFSVPWFKRYRPEIIDEYVLAAAKVAAHADELRDR